MITEDPDQRRWALEQGEQVLGRGCVFHNYFWFYRDAIEVALKTADWAGLERYASALERFTAAEPVPWTSFFIARGRALAAHGQGRHDQATLRELRRLRDEAAAAGFRSALPALERAVAAAPAWRRRPTEARQSASTARPETRSRPSDPTVLAAATARPYAVAAVAAEDGRRGEPDRRSCNGHGSPRRTMGTSRPSHRVGLLVRVTRALDPRPRRRVARERSGACEPDHKHAAFVGLA